MLCVLVLGALPQKRQKAGSLLVTVSDLTWRRDRRKEEETERRKKSRSKSLHHDWSTRCRNMGREAGGEQGWRQSTGRRDRETERFTCTGYLDVCQTRQSDVRERERDSETDTYRQPQGRKTERETQGMQTSTRDRQTD